MPKPYQYTVSVKFNILAESPMEAIDKARLGSANLKEMDIVYTVTKVGWWRKLFRKLNK